MSQEFVTPEELALTLRAYAKASEVDSRLRDTDSAIRVFVERTLEIANRQLLTKVALDLDAVKTDTQKALSTQISLQRTKFTLGMPQNVGPIPQQPTECGILGSILDAVPRRDALSNLRG